MNRDIYLNDIIDLVNGNLLIGENTILSNFKINSKDIENGDIFIGIKGEKIDGSKFYLDALKKGAKGCIINKGFCTELIDNKFILEVDDTINALQKIASLKRDKLDIPVIGITGSVGKTSTKDMISSVLETKYKVCKTKGNLNNHIGVPLTILSIKDEEVLVVEMGMNHLGEISVLSKILKPTIGVITNVGTAHIGNLGSRENILKAKLEIMDGLTGKLIINNDNDMLNNYYKNNKNNVITIGINNDSHYMAKDINYKEYTSFKYNNEEIVLKVGGEAFIYNSLIAIAVGDNLGIDIGDIKKGIENFKLTNNRLEIICAKGYKIINDCYNANFDSVKEGLNNLNKYNGRKIAVLGDMLELGSYSIELHKKVGEEVLNNNIDILVTVGPLSINTYNVVKNKIVSYHFDNNIDAINCLKDIIKENDVILVKASNGMNFIDIVNSLK